MADKAKNFRKRLSLKRNNEIKVNPQEIKNEQDDEISKFIKNEAEKYNKVNSELDPLEYLEKKESITPSKISKVDDPIKYLEKITEENEERIKKEEEDKLKKFIEENPGQILPTNNKEQTNPKLLGSLSRTTDDYVNKIKEMVKEYDEELPDENPTDLNDKTSKQKLFKRMETARLSLGGGFRKNFSLKNTKKPCISKESVDMFITDSDIQKVNEEKYTATKGIEMDFSEFKKSKK